MTSSYLLPVGLLNGPGAERAVATGQARWLAGGSLAFNAVTQISRAADGSGQRRALPLALAEELAPAQMAALSAPRSPWAGFDLSRPLIMGIINVTPDSFSDGGDNADAETAIAFGERLLAAGADILDIGGESTRPGSQEVPADEEIRRVIPVIRTLAGKGAVISVDTRHADVMQAAIKTGARIINDVTALTGDPRSQKAAVESGGDLVLMHMQGKPQTMQQAPNYADVTLDLLDYFTERLATLARLGLDAAKVSLDPGIGFGKNDQHNRLLLDELAAFHGFGCPITLGVSRKSFISRLSRKEPPKDRLAGSLAAGLAGLARGVQILRVHDVAETYQAIRVWQGISR
ncbi:MAG: dihydropteroate synthase [Dongiaceae bacterium]